MSFQPQWDMLIYLVCLQLLLISTIWKLGISDPQIDYQSSQLFAGFSILTVMFWLVWGGYSTDAWRYLTRFEHNPLGFQNEQLFWIVGNSFWKVFPNPWPVKILSSISLLILSFSYYYFERTNKSKLIFAYILLLATPGFFLLNGNVIRQGISGSIAVLGIALFLKGNYWKWLILAVPAFFIHQFSLLVFLSLPILKLFKKHLLLIWLVSPFLGLLANFLLSVYDLSLANFLNYTSYNEGDYHWEKFLVSTSISIVLLISIWRSPPSDLDFRQVYIILVSISNVILQYEVPYERLLLFADLTAPLALSQVLMSKYLSIVKSRFVLSAIFFASVLLWTSTSVVNTLGY